MTQSRYKILEKYNFQVPRYTSYPPATRFGEAQESDTYEGWLAGAAKSISLYVHIPFCARLCHYCGCNMRVVNTYQPVEDYLDAMKAEIELVRQKLPKNIALSHLHFGGGSPTILKPADFRRLMHSLEQAFPFNDGIEISIEADPRNLSEAKIASYAKCGVNRISLGVQDFNEEVLDLINRPQPFHITYRAIQLCRAYGINNINFDLMYGLPAQTKDSVLKTLDMAVSLHPSRIAYFGYAHVPWMKRHMNLMPEDRMPTPKERYILQESGAAFLEDAGYIPVGIDHFALATDSMAAALEHKTLHRNFQGYTTDDAVCLVGLGASSISGFPQGYAQNAVSVRDYMDDVSQKRLPVRKILPLTADDQPVKNIIEQIMCYLRVDLDAIRSKFNLPPHIFAHEKLLLKPLEEDGLVAIKGNVIEVNPQYRVLARVVCEAFDRYAVKDASFQRHAQAV